MEPHASAWGYYGSQRKPQADAWGCIASKSSGQVPRLTPGVITPSRQGGDPATAKMVPDCPPGQPNRTHASTIFPALSRASYATASIGPATATSPQFPGCEHQSVITSAVISG